MNRFLFLIVLLPFFLTAQDTTVDSLRLALKSATHDTVRCTILATLTELAPEGEWEKYNEQLGLIAERNLMAGTSMEKFYKKHLANSFNNTGYVYYNKGEIKKAVDYYSKSLRLQEELGDKYGISAALNNIGAVYQDQGDNPRAVECFEKALSLVKELKDEHGVALSLNKIGAVFHDQGDLGKAIDYYQKSLQIRQKIGDKPGMANCLNNIAGVYHDRGDVSTALDYFSRSL